jgi:hypothetical protein
MPHPHLWPALLGAILGLPLIGWASWTLSKRGAGLAPRWRWIAFGGMALLQCFYWANIYAWFVEPNMLVVRRVEIVSEHWRSAPLTIAAIGDTHVGGPHVSLERMSAVMRRVNALRPDLVVVLGDYAPGHAPEAERTAEDQNTTLAGVATFAGSTAPLGVVGVIGNHDVWYGRGSITRSLEEAGVAALWNRNVEIARPGGHFFVAGIADDHTGIVDFGAALDGTEGRDTIVISHSPDPFAEMPEGAAIMIAAHTHCGQVTIPFVGRPFLPIRHKQYGCGLVREAGRVLYVNAGLGTSIVPLRFLNPPEITLISIRSAHVSMPEDTGSSR